MAECASLRNLAMQHNFALRERMVNKNEIVIVNSFFIIYLKRFNNCEEKNPGIQMN